ncbi:MAG: hypothetical protein H6755_07475 [Candidatus Omnitrophica bacterium]|nr:hypothetical protein [Candidatus Omnitrophota bacterium]MCB9748232.1 hypothetical protein [Candidatus Omnitrophota bacterium]
MNIEKKKTVEKLIKFFLILCVLDFVTGGVYQELFFRQKSGKFSRATYVLEKSHEDIFVFGSSNAVQHYVPDIFNKELEFSFYNAGSLGQGILYAKAVEDAILKRHKPKAIVLNIDQKMLHQDKEIFSRLTMLRPYYTRHQEIQPYLELTSKFERIKQFSKLYAFNSTILHVLRYTIFPQKDFAGYVPKFGIVNDQVIGRPMNDQRWQKEMPSLDDRNVKALDQFIADALKNNIKVAVVISPLHKEATFFDETSMQAITSILQKYKVPLWDYSRDSRFLTTKEYFNDLYHLNDNGARVFSEIIAQRLKQECLNNNTEIAVIN